MTLAHRLFSFEGRLRRRDWWLFSLGLFATELAVVKGFEILVFGPSGELTRGNVFSWLFEDAPGPLMMAVEVLAMAMFFWPNLAITIKRSHDRDTEGTWLKGALIASFAMGLVPGGFFERSGRSLDQGDWLGGAPMLGAILLGLIMVAFIIVQGCFKGTPGPNRFGPSPKTGDEIDVAEVFE